MKVLILTATIGQGHNTCASSIQEGFLRKNIPVETLDLYGYISPQLKSIVEYSYLWGISFTSAKSTRFIGDLTYKSMENSSDKKQAFSMAEKINKLVAMELLAYIKIYNPDVIISTQVNCMHCINYLKKEKLIDSMTLSILTDFTVQSHWRESEYIDYIVTANRNLNYQLVKKKIPVKKVLPIGIPIHPKFSESTDKIIARTLLGIDPIKPTLLISGGSMGYGNLNTVIEKLDKLPVDFQFIIVCGKNKKLYNQITNMNLKKQKKIFAFTDEMNLIMDASDVIITKPGGISVSESLAKGLAIVLTNPIPGMEDHNCDFLCNNLLAISTSKFTSIEELIFNLFYDKILLNKLSVSSKIAGKPDSTMELCNFVVKRFNKKRLTY